MTHARVVALPRSSQPQDTKSQTSAAVNAAISRSPSLPTACIIERQRKIQRMSSAMPSTTWAGVNDGKVPLTQ